MFHCIPVYAEKFESKFDSMCMKNFFKKLKIKKRKRGEETF